MLDRTTRTQLLEKLNTLGPSEVQKVIEFVDALASSDSMRVKRQRSVERAIAQVRLEGLEPSVEFLKEAERFIEGQVTIEAMLTATLTRARS